MAKARGSGTGNNRNRNNNEGGDETTEDDDDGGGGGLDDSVRDELRRMVNATVSSQLGRKLDTAIKSALDGAMAPIAEQLQALTQGGGKGKRKESDEEETKTKAGPDPEVVAMKKRLAAMEDERKQERAQADARERDGMLREALGKIGVDSNRMRGAVAVLRDNVKKDENGEWVYKAQRDGYVEDLDLAKGAAEWGATDEGKSYRAPVNGKRDGARERPAAGQVNVIGQRQGNGDAKAKQAQQQEAKVERKEEAMDKLAGAVSSLIGGANINVG